MQIPQLSSSLRPYRSEKIMHRPSSITTWICIAFCSFIVETYSLRLGKYVYYFKISLWKCPLIIVLSIFMGRPKGFIHDESLDLVQPTSPLDKWMSSVLDDALGIQCPTSLNFTTLEILSDESMINTNHHLLGKVFSWLYNCLTYIF